MVQEDLPETLFVFPLRRAVPFPNLMMPIALETPRSREIVAQAEAGSGYVLLLAQRDAEQDQPAARDFYEVGVIARVLRVFKMPDGSSKAAFQGLRRARVVRFVREEPLLLAKVK